MPKSPVTFRKQRIAWSVACGIIGLLLVAVCSAIQYRGADIELMRRGGPGPTLVMIHDGKLSLSWEPRTPYRPKWAGQTNRYGFLYNMYSNGHWNFWGPLWAAGAMLLAVVAALAAAPWLTWRFTLRSAIIAMTVVAGLLGMAVAL